MFLKLAEIININGPIIMPFLQLRSLQVVLSDLEVILGVLSRYSLPLLIQESVNSKVVGGGKCL